MGFYYDDATHYHLQTIGLFPLVRSTIPLVCGVDSYLAVRVVYSVIRHLVRWKLLDPMYSSLLGLA